MTNTNLIVRPWRDYELLDSGNNKKLERYGKYVLIRPETQAIWRPNQPSLWNQAVAEFNWNDGKGSWKKKKEVPETWDMLWNDAHFTVRLTSFKHTGIFPEQAVNWEWLIEQVMQLKQPKVLNLFGYTGIASIVAAKHDAHVTHVDASKQSNLWAKENAQLSEVPTEHIRYILDDALAFVKREVRRGTVYDGIILDPPAFGRGPDGEVWRIEDHLPHLLEAIVPIFSKKPGAFFLLNGYAAGYSPHSLLQAVAHFFPEKKKNSKAEFGELQIQEANSSRIVPQGIYVRFVNQ